MRKKILKCNFFCVFECFFIFFNWSKIFYLSLFILVLILYIIVCVIVVDFNVDI